MLWSKEFLSPINLTFFIIVCGYYIGRIKLFNLSFDLAGVLITAIITGVLLEQSDFLDDGQFVYGLLTNMHAFSSIGTALFVSSIGISAGYSFDASIKKDWPAAVIGSIMVIASMITMKILSLADIGLSPSILLGELCGALTTTPGLSTVHELPGVIREEAVLGYGCAYLPGVIFTALCAQIVSAHSNDIPITSDYKNDAKAATENSQALIQICLTILLGNLIGQIKIPFVPFSLGTSGGILCVGLLFGYLVKSFYVRHQAPKIVLDTLRSIGLVLFFVGSGLPAGINLKNGINMTMIGVGLLMTIVPLITCCLFCKIVSLKSDLNTASILAGGMTSTPTIGILAQEGKQMSLRQYSLAYIGALFTIIIGVRALG